MYVAFARGRSSAVVEGFNSLVARVERDRLSKHTSHQWTEDRLRCAQNGPSRDEFDPTPIVASLRAAGGRRVLTVAEVEAAESDRANSTLQARQKRANDLRAAARNVEQKEHRDVLAVRYFFFSR